MNNHTRITGTLCLLATLLLPWAPGSAQRSTGRKSSTPPASQSKADTNERGIIKAEEFTGSRPGGNSYLGGYRSRRRIPQGRTYTTVGVTISRARPATDAERKDHSVAKMIPPDTTEHVLERITDDAPVTNGTQIQMIIEYLAFHDASGRTQSNRIGYLYVINREQYPKERYGMPTLIFPTRRTYGGDNRVLPGKTVTLPMPKRLWTVSRSTSGTVQAFETYIVIISPQPLKDSSGLELAGDNLSDRPRKLEATLVDSWVHDWGGGEWRGDLDKGKGQLITQREQEASGDTDARARTTSEESSDLTKDDPPPQIVFRKVIAPGGKLLVTIKLPYKETAGKPASR